jgi:ABC-type amino acid transport substrate-binding protein
MYQTGWPDESGLASFRPAWARGPSLHFLVGNTHSSAPQLQAAINSAIEQARKSGVIRQLRDKYLDASRKPTWTK